MPFSTIKGQAYAVDYLRRAKANQRLAHALLFTGPEGVGKRTTALALAQALNCTAPVDADACGQCPACQKIAHDSHPDVRVIAAEGSSLKIDQIRELVQKDVSLRPLEGAWKVYILDEAERLTPEASNSLLKVLEEAPDQVLLVLITSQPYGLMPTVRSRCQEVRFHAWERGVLADWLRQRLNIPADAATALAMLAGGRPAESLRLADPEWQEQRNRLIELANTRQPGSWPAAAAATADLQAEAADVLGFLLQWFRDAAVLASGAPARLVMNADRLAELRAEAGRSGLAASLEQCRSVFAALGQTKRNINAQLLLETLWLNLGRIGIR